MAASVTLGRVRGIPVRLHWTLILALPVFAYFMARAYFAEPAGALVPGATSLAWGAGLAVFLFATILLHELGHSVVAQREGLPVRGITLWPLGGVSGIPQMGNRPGAEMRLTAAGPLVNLAIGVPLLAAAWWLAGGDVARLQALSDPVAFVAWAGVLSVFIGLFNLLVPAFPMDGGRLLRAFLAKRVGFQRATHIAVLVGRGLAALMVVAGIVLGSILLALVGVFVWSAAGAEESAAERRGDAREARG